MKKMSVNEMSVLNGGKSKRCGGCGNTYRTWLTYTYHCLGKSTWMKCLTYVVGHEW